MSRARRSKSQAIISEAVTARAPSHTLVASATLLSDENPLARVIVTTPREWQREVWNFYHALGELNYAVGVWLANCLSRCRLIAAELVPGGDEPTPIKEGPYADLVQSLCGGIGGQSALLKKMAVQLSIPGDSYLVGEDPQATGDPRQFSWRVFSSSEIRVTSRNPLKYQVQEYESVWRTLDPESLVVRIWYPDDELSWMAASPAQAALSIMREVDFFNRYIVAVMLSRLVCNGLLAIPSEATLPAKPQFKDSPDPFIAELIDIGTKSIANPGTASAALPMPIRVPADMIDKIKHITFATPVEERVHELRTAALGRLATALNMPTEVLTGVGDMNHWGQWQLEESGIKTYISPLIEVICYGLLIGYMQPMARAANLNMRGPNGGQVVVWYDPSELTKQPDRVKETTDLYDRGEAKGEALRREAGIEESDKPEMEELKRIVLQKIALQGGADSLFALAKLTGDDSLIPPAPAPVAGPEDGQPGTAEPPSDTQQPPSGSRPTAPGAPETRPTQRPTLALATALLTSRSERV